MMLSAREKRVERQEKLLKECSCLVCFTMNIAGPYKISDCIMGAYAQGVAKIYRLLEQNGIKTVKAEQVTEKTGVDVNFIVPAGNEAEQELHTSHIQGNLLVRSALQHPSLPTWSCAASWTFH